MSRISRAAKEGVCVSHCVNSTGEALITKRLSLGEYVVKADNMFAKAVLGLSDSSELCPFLQEMDRVETQLQVEEQRQIQEKRVEVKAGLNAVVGTEIGAFFGAIFFVIIPIPPVSAMLTVAAGGIAAAISDNTDAFGSATQYAEKNLNIYGKRVRRLAGMVDKIARELAVPGKEASELAQLRRVERGFSAEISLYRAWQDHIKLPCCC